MPARGFTLVVGALARVQRTQEQNRSAHGLYTSDLRALAGAATSPQGHSAISIELTGGETYRATMPVSGFELEARIAPAQMPIFTGSQPGSPPSTE